MHWTQTRIVLTSPLGKLALMDCKLGIKRRLVIPVTLVPTPPKYLALPRVSTALPTIGPLLQTSQTLAIFHLTIGPIDYFAVDLPTFQARFLHKRAPKYIDRARESNVKKAQIAAKANRPMAIPLNLLAERGEPSGKVPENGHFSLNAREVLRTHAFSVAEAVKAFEAYQYPKVSNETLDAFRYLPRDRREVHEDATKSEGTV